MAKIDAYEFLAEARKVPSFATSDERLRSGGWMIALIGGTHRDADSVAQSNHEVLCERLTAADPEGGAGGSEHWDVLRCSHWAVGWCDHVIVDPTNEAVMRVIAECGAALADYPILSDDHHSTLEHEWHEEGKCGEGCSFEHCSQCATALHDHARGNRCMSC